MKQMSRGRQKEAGGGANLRLALLEILGSDLRAEVGLVIAAHCHDLLPVIVLYQPF